MIDGPATPTTLVEASQEVKLLKGFKEFMTQGNALDLAIAFVLGAAFTAFVTSLTDNLVTPLINLLLGGGVDAGTITIDGQVIDVTAMINAFITFFITAVVVYFLFVAPMNKLREMRGVKSDDEETAEEVALLREIRDALSRRRPSTPDTADGGRDPQS